jgi:hypothetical protein
MAQVTAMSGTITNSASVSATEGDPNGGNNSGSTPPLPVLSTEEIPALSEYALLALVAALIAVAAWRSS